MVKINPLLVFDNVICFKTIKEAQQKGFPKKSHQLTLFWTFTRFILTLCLISFFSLSSEQPSYIFPRRHSGAVAFTWLLFYLQSCTFACFPCGQGGDVFYSTNINTVFHLFLKLNRNIKYLCPRGGKMCCITLRKKYK